MRRSRVRSPVGYRAHALTVGEQRLLHAAEGERQLVVRGGNLDQAEEEPVDILLAALDAQAEQRGAQLLPRQRAVEIVVEKAKERAHRRSAVDQTRLAGGVAAAAECHAAVCQRLSCFVAS